MRNFFYFCLGLLISVGLFFVPYAHATFVQYDAGGNVVGSMTDARRESFVRAYGVLDQTTGHVVVKGTQVPVSVGAQVGKGAIAKAAAKIGAKAIPGVATAAAIVELCALLCPGGDYRLSPDGASLQQPEKPGLPGDPAGTGYGVGNGPMAKSPSAVCPMLNHSDSFWDYSYTLSGSQCRGTMVRRSDGFTAASPNVFNISKHYSWYVPDYILATEVQTEADVLARAEQQAKFKPLYDAIMADRAANPTAWPPDYNPVKANTPAEVNAPPASSPSRVVSTTTKTLPDGSVDTTTTTEKTVVTPTTTGTTVGDSKTTFPTQTVTTSTTINNVTNNTTTETNTTNHPAEETPTQDDEDLSFVDPDMPDIPDLYEQKYPDGIAGVWRDNKPNIEATQFWQGIKTMFPNFSGGQCPAWSMSFSIMNGANFGVKQFDVPCWIFQAIGLILMTTAAFTARKIIF